MTLGFLFVLSASLSNFETVRPDTHNLAGPSDSLVCNSVKHSRGLDRFSHTIADWASLVTLHPSISTCEAAASCATMLDVVRTGCRPASGPLEFCRLIMDYWLCISTVVGTVARGSRSGVLVSAGRARRRARRCRSQRVAVIVAHDHIVWPSLHPLLDIRLRMVSHSR